ncbi:MAG: hypothetical protein ACRC37_02960 [Lentisphaeria bacterium]
MNWLIIAKHTFKGCLALPFFIAIISILFIFAATLPLLSQFAFYQQQKLIIDSACGLSLILTIIISSFSAYELFSKEINGELQHLIFSKPISFLSYFIGKLIGIATANFLFIFIAMLITINIHNIIPDNFQINQNRLIIFICTGIISLIIAQIVNYFSSISVTHTLIIVSSFFLIIVSIIINYPSHQLLLISQMYFLVFTATTIFLAIILICAFINSLSFILSIAIVSLIIGSCMHTQNFLPKWSNFMACELFFKKDNNLSKLMMTSTITMFYYCALASLIALLIFKIKKSKR